MTKIMKYVCVSGKLVLWVILALSIIAGGTFVSYSAISSLAGLAVAQSSTQWNNVKDAAVGDGLTNGILASALMVFNGLTFDRVRGDTTNGLDVDVTRLPGGSFTPADAVANPSSIPASEAFNMIFNGSTWDRKRGSPSADGVAATGLQSTANMVFNGSTWDRWNGVIRGLGSGATGGVRTAPSVCDSFANVNVTTATTTLLVTGVSGRHVRICGLSLVTAAANNAALISGTGATCGTGTTGMNGGTTAASGYNFAANSGISQGSGFGEINRTNATGDSVCIVTSAATQLSGRISYTIY